MSKNRTRSCRVAPIAPTAAAIALLAGLAAGQDISLAEGPAARAWAGVGPGTMVPRLTLDDLPPAAGDPSWERAEPWLEWARLVRAEGDAVAASEPADGRRRARLALLAWQHNRSDDAWQHLAACTAEPGWMAAAIPHLLPGVPLELLLTGGADSGIGLPAGVLLQPALPPPPIPAAEIELGTGRIRSSQMKVTHQRIGDAVVSLNYVLEYDGIQIDAELLSGEPVRFSVLLPEPPDFEIGVQYVDWIRQDEVGIPLEVTLDAERPVRHLFGRYRPRKVDWPSVPPEVFGARFSRHGLRLAIGPDDPWEARIAGLAQGFELMLGCDVEPVVIAPAAAGDAWPGVTLHLFDDADRARKLMTMISLSERFALSGAHIADR